MNVSCKAPKGQRGDLNRQSRMAGFFGERYGPQYIPNKRSNIFGQRFKTRETFTKKRADAPVHTAPFKKSRVRAAYLLSLRKEPSVNQEWLTKHILENNR